MSDERRMSDEQSMSESSGVHVGRISRARVKPTGTRRELFVWYLMRVTGVALFVLALAILGIVGLILVFVA